MQIIHILRGDDHLQNTFQQLNLIKHLRSALPIYAHLPMVLQQDRQRLSKRDCAADVTNYRMQGYLSQALLNCLVHLGWSKGDQEVFARAELIEHFDLAAIHKSPAALNLQKLDWLNAHYLAAWPLSQLSAAVASRLCELGVSIKRSSSFAEIIAQMRSRYKTTASLADGLLFIYRQPNYDTQSIQSYQDPKLIELLQILLRHIKQLEVWNTATLKTMLSDFSAAHNIKLGFIAKPLRFALTANALSPALGVVMMWIGKAEGILRIKRCMQLLSASSDKQDSASGVAAAQSAAVPPACNTAEVDDDSDGLIEICYIEDLNAVRHQLDGSAYQADSGATTSTLGCLDAGCRGYELVRDLDFTAAASYRDAANRSSYTEGAGWSLIGDAGSPFSGVFIGNNYRLSHLRMQRSDVDGTWGMFAETSDAAHIDGLALTSLAIDIASHSIRGTNYKLWVSALVARNRGAITNSSARGDITVRSYFPERRNSVEIGGLVARNVASSAHITNCYTVVRSETVIFGLARRRHQLEG